MEAFETGFVHSGICRFSISAFRPFMYNVVMFKSGVAFYYLLSACFFCFPSLCFFIGLFENFNSTLKLINELFTISLCKN
jgi:hypothetical protein